MNNQTETLEQQATRLVDNEVCYGVSQLINELASNDEYIDDIMEFSCKPDYEAALHEFVYYSDYSQLAELCELLNSSSSVWDYLEENELKEEGLRDHLWYECTETGVETVAYDLNLDYDYKEALQFWLVSDWLADKLIEKGEMVNKDFLGLTVWGRCTSGQLISADHVIEQITKELHED